MPSILEKEYFPIAKTCHLPGKIKMDHKVFDQIVKNFDVKEHEPPMVYGHIRSEHNSLPANGWINKVKVVGDTLYAKAKQVWGKFDQELRDGRYKKRSIGLRKNAAGEYYLHHLGWLGGVVPAVKGMPNAYTDFQFNNDTEDLEIYEFTDNELSIINKPIKRSNTMPPFADMTESELNDKIAEAVTKKSEKDKVDFADQLKTATKDAEAKGKKAAEKEFDEKLEAKTAAANFSEKIKTYLDDNAKGEEAFINPAMRKAGLGTIFSALNSIENDLEFTEGDTTVKKSGAEMLKDVLKAVTANPEENFDDTDEEDIHKQKADRIKNRLKNKKKGAEMSDADFAESEKEIKKYMKENKVNYSTAMLELRKEDGVDFEDDRVPAEKL